VEKLRRFNEAHFSASRADKSLKVPRFAKCGVHKSPHSDRRRKRAEDLTRSCNLFGNHTGEAAAIITGSFALLHPAGEAQ
jgi:hypothetical protein